jgi:hypothetical protein
VRKTVLAIADELTEDELVLRYQVEETDDGFYGEEGTFTICSFWLVSALAEIGEGERARALCDKLFSYASPLALYAEEIDPHSGRHLGNFPQAFSHLALINAVMRLIREDECRPPGLNLRPDAAPADQNEPPEPGLWGIVLSRGLSASLSDNGPRGAAQTRCIVFVSARPEKPAHRKAAEQCSRGSPTGRGAS